MENTIICPSMSKLGWGLRSVDSCSVLLKVKVRVMQTQVSGSKLLVELGHINKGSLHIKQSCSQSVNL
jgi:hypothetical protein